jgi:pseudouridine-5'-monophosphatase
MLDELFPETEPMPGAVRLSRHLYRHGIPMAVATSSDRRHFELKITRHREWFRIFSSVVTGDDPAVGRGKPAPDIFLLAARTIGADPRRCLVFEDSPAGVEAALAAGMCVVAVPDPHMDEAAYGGAHQVIRSLEEADLPAWGLPPFPEEA